MNKRRSQSLNKNTYRLLITIVTVSFCLIGLRLYHLCILEHDTFVLESKKPQNKTSVTSPKRGTICDRFNLPLAVNKVQYQIGVIFDPIRQYPKILWQYDSTSKKKVKTHPRRDYIENLSQFLADELQQEAFDIEDLIYGKAVLFPNTPFIISWDVDEATYYKMKHAERMWPGVFAGRSEKRYYPKGKIAAEIIGYLGSMQLNDYERLVNEITTLSDFLDKYNRGDVVFYPKGFSNLNEIKSRLNELNEKAYRFTDVVGKAGVEAYFDKDLRGVPGRDHIEIDTNGRFIRKLPGSKDASSGKRLSLNISAELQEFGDQLLAESEEIRDDKFPDFGKEQKHLPNPWIKGGSIVAICPNSGQILAICSYPRIDNNDFINTQNQQTLREQKKKINQWLETKTSIANLWNGKTSLEKELYSRSSNDFYLKTKDLNLENYLDMTLSKSSKVKKVFKGFHSLQEILSFLETIESLTSLSEQPQVFSVIDAIYPEKSGHKPSCLVTSKDLMASINQAFDNHKDHVDMLKNNLALFFDPIKHNDDKLLLIDLCRLISPKQNSKRTPSFLLTMSPGEYKNLTQSYCILEEEVYDIAKRVFHVHDFQDWRKENFKAFLKEKRLSEKQRKTYQRPFLDYLVKEEKKQFHEFWNKHKAYLIQSFLQLEKSLYLPRPPALDPYFMAFKELNISISKRSKQLQKAVISLRSHLETFSGSLESAFSALPRYENLKAPLFGYYPQLGVKKGTQTLKDLAGAFYPRDGFGYGRSFGYRQSTPMGSIFKVITAYEALKQTHDKQILLNRPLNLNPFVITDETRINKKQPHKTVLGIHEDGTKITRRYKGGTLPRSHATLGKIDLVSAMERSSNLYFSLLAAEVLEDPEDLVSAALLFGLGEASGIDLPNEFPGVLPKDLSKNKTGLYSFAIGQHSLIATPMQTALMMSALANGGKLLSPRIVNECSSSQQKASFFDENYHFKDWLASVGIYFPCFLERQQVSEEKQVLPYMAQVKRAIDIPEPVRDYLLKSLHSVVSSGKGSARPEVIHYLYGNTPAMKEYKKMRHQLAGKTSSAEKMYNPTLDREQKPIICSDIWFGGISYLAQRKHLLSAETDPIDPELVVVVYLRYGDYGKEAAPLAAQMVQKWRSILKKQSDYVNDDEFSDRQRAVVSSTFSFEK